MAKKRTLSPNELDSMRNMLQTAAISALMKSRRWEPGEIAFQGGTSLNLAHGSARFSEDLDFMIRGGMSLTDFSSSVGANLVLPSDVKSDLKVSVTKGKDGNNPHCFYVTLGGPDVIGSAKVKIELWQTPQKALDSLKLVVSTVKTDLGVAYVPTLTVEEIHADKVYALGGRNRIKPRDVFDLWWLMDEKKVKPLSQKSLETRLEIYPGPSSDKSETAQIWMENAQERLDDLKSENAPAMVSEDLKRWLPSYWKMNEEVAAEMLRVSIAELENGMSLMRELDLDEYSDKTHEKNTSHE
jgi:predicted nucleotidyltransferase component of viral defense system